MDNGISALVLARNEEKTLERCLKSLSFCNEIIVLNNNSSDNTAGLSRHLGARVITHPQSNFADQRNFGLKEAKNQWVLFVDADEVVEKDLAQEIKSKISLNNFNAYFIPRIDIWWGKRLYYGEVKRAVSRGFIRLMKKDAGIWKGAVHEEFIPTKTAGKLNHPLYHYPHPALKDFLNDINEYSTIRAKELDTHKVNVTFADIIMYPCIKFFLSYFIHMGFLDGPQGFAYSFLMSFHSFLVRVKLYQYRNMNEKK